MSKAQLGRLIELPDDALQQVLDYASTLSKAEAAEHFSNLLGSDPAAVEFVAAFNARRHDPAAGSASSVAAASHSGANTPGTSSPGAIEPVPKHHRQKKKKAPLHTPPPRQVTNLAPPPGAVYNKKDVGGDYMGGRSSGTTTPLAVAAAGIARGATPVSASTTPPPQPSPKKQPSPQPQASAPSQSQKQQRSGAGGSLIQDALGPKTKNRASSKDTSSTKINITGGTAMHGAATALADFDAAIRSLEVSTNPTLANNGSGNGKDGQDSVSARRCNCVATRHPLQKAAPNCMSCGKVICVKEGLGPCTSCGAPLLSPADVQAMIKELRAERGREKMAADREANRRIDVSYGGKNRMGAAMTHAQHASGPHMIAGQAKWGGDDNGFVSLAEAAKAAETQMQTAEAKARAHRDKLLAFQAQNAQRTTVRDEAADFDVGDAMASGGDGDTPTSRNLWATPEERARELRRQQKLLREMEWNARPEYEKRQQVLSIDVTGRKVFRKAVVMDRPPTPKSDDDDDNVNDEYGHGGKGAAILTDADGNKDTSASRRTAGSGAFSKNPLLGHLIKPVYDAQSRVKAAEKDKTEKEHGKGKGKTKDNEASKGKRKAEAKQEEAASSSKDASEASPLPGRRDNPNAASRWRRVQDDLDNNEAVILDGGIYGAGVPKSTLPAGDEPESG
ncbi:c2hc5 finger protein [Sporothrix schenckii 1099-18]|uniref:C2hc5 finger protein n=1 Tax=Sporothrix schenckii 1099-18 TaxID=1397361 RepID=A0A0F2MFD1_SPOSC|nr:c2hc5 finger protein [Sporothrix schenckii 1099-18]KJR88342.1 c2hc5 finger protein [Sporothrix schenckii 1099-18]